MRRILTIVLLVAGGWPSLAAAQSYTLAPSPYLLITDTSNNPVNAGCIWTYAAGTLTNATTYSDSAGTPNTQPIIADSAGRFVAYLTPGSSYKFVYENTPCSASGHGTTIRTQDNISAVPVSGLNVDVTVTAGATLAAGDVVYVSDGSGALNAGQAYQADADNTYSSTAAVTVGIATAAITATSSGTIRTTGRMTGLSGLTAGEIYYASGTAGALTATPPTNARCVGKADSTTSLVMPCDVGDVRLPDSDGTHSVVVRTSSNLTADRLLTLVPGDAARTLTLNSDVTLNGPLYTVQTITLTGTQNDVAVTASRYLLLRCNNASLLTITGFTAGSDGDIIDVVSVNAQVELDHQTGSSAANQLINTTTVGNTALAAGNGKARYVYDATTARWRLTSHEQGGWITPAFSAGDFTSGSGTWTVAAGDVTTYAYWLKGKTLTVTYYLVTTTTGTTPSSLIVAIPAGYTATKAVQTMVTGSDGATRVSVRAAVAASGTTITNLIVPSANWTNQTDATELYGQLLIEVN